jgi:hypothetical protein
MFLKGTVRNGVVVLDEGVKLPEGERVRVLAERPADEPTLAEKMLRHAGTLDLPPDTSTNHDHYAHGAPKR